MLGRLNWHFSGISVRGGGGGGQGEGVGVISISILDIKDITRV